MTTQPDSMTKDEGLLPCPFCGVGAPAVWLYRDKPNHIIEPKWNAHCKVCNIVISARGKKEAIAAWNRRPTPSIADNALTEAAKDVVDRAFGHYRARNGRMCSIEGDDGEKCWIVPFDAMEDLRQALTSSPAAEAEPVAGDALDWLKVAKLAGEHGIRYRTNRALEQFLAAISSKPTPVEAGAVRPDRDVIAYSIIEGSAGIRAAEHAKDFQTANWTDALRSADSVIACLAALSQPGRGESGGVEA
ncbi:hypothetical protein [Sphingobium sp. CFD-1]|uniref:hypothetical protein n=1 Tax=Sphingobium sp. CFD-1 TaxID=2878545 RepID=UPI00214B7B2A|nr:hypothetical protein [Sphingobium sp. CFD-1]